MTYKTYEVRVYDDGTKNWYHNGKLHREDGPAVEWAYGSKEWYLNGIIYSEEGFWRRVKLLSKPKELTVAEVEKILGYPVKIVKDA